MQFKKVTHVIFDMDGLLIDSESIYDEIISEILAQFGKEYTDDCKLKVLGTTQIDTAKIVLKESQIPLTLEEFLKQFRKATQIALQNPVMMPGARELVKHLYKNEIPIAVATSSSQELMELKTKPHQDVFKLFHHIVCGSTDKEVKNGKPAPDIFLICASRFPENPDPANCLVFEDAPNGVKGASRAGMQSVMVPAPYIPQELRKNATVVLDSLKEFKPELFGLPERE
ncbi:probable pseudouridine-5'-phosphatase [Leptinotarsa decemlineata]|uniref:probable pseudouridine-5'-phosphatase n=1 Tax=Leptinotarsa decemlineata TaxID=7539 RepID=UPI003D306735